MHTVIAWHRSGDNRVWHWTHRQTMSGSRCTIECRIVRSARELFLFFSFRGSCLTVSEAYDATVAAVD